MRVSFVYFIAPIGGGHIKIGCSYAPIDRLETLMAWSPYPLEVLATAPGTPDDERTLHGLFVAQWSHREWFRATPDLYALINEIRATGVLPERILTSKRAGRALPTKARKPWTEEQRQKLSNQHKRRWTGLRKVRAAKEEMEAFLRASGMGDRELEQAVGLVGIVGQTRRENPYFSEEVEKLLAYIRRPKGAAA